MNRQDPPNRPRYQLTRGLIGLYNKKDAMTSLCLDRKYDVPPGECTVLGRLFLLFGGPVCADWISNCPLDRVLTSKNLIYLLNLQFYQFGYITSCNKIMMTIHRKDEYF